MCHWWTLKCSSIDRQITVLGQKKNATGQKKIDEGPRRVGPRTQKRWSPECWGGPKFRSLFSLSASIFALFVALWVSSRGILVVFDIEIRLQVKKNMELLEALANLMDSPVVGEALGGAENCGQGELGGHYLAPVETVRKAIVEEFVWRQGGVGAQAASVAGTDMVEDVPSW